MLTRLNFVTTERPLAAKLKRKCVSNEIINTSAAKLRNCTNRMRSLFSKQIERLRLLVEKERTSQYKAALQISGRLYYKLIVKMLVKNLPKSEILRKFAMHVKGVIELGGKFEANHLIRIIEEIGLSDMTAQEER
eukprot:TRINITY_DN8824_c0_g1_i2.p1 TRINITY_DN8824_c0_g1~~TRINITY_DN8824_c0_g1_i2.p1  ORF type:complete len:135 (+),score=28.64 TRINITY_DN8824_c0_g1_i2:223-627(+)